MVDNVHSMIRELKAHADENNVPIMMDGSINYISNFIIKNKIKNVLEIGTAIGYSAIMMALSDPNVKITTIEKDEERYLEAVKNIKKFNLENRITLMFNDALEVKLSDTFDLIVIDGAKGQNQNF